MTNIELLDYFIKKNELSFNEGERNTNLVPLCGYACYIEANQEDINEALKKNTFITLDLEEELERVYDYAYINNYENYWTTLKAKKSYDFVDTE